MTISDDLACILTPDARRASGVLVAAPDKFRGSATASEVAHAMALASRQVGWECREAPLADGGEGTLDALGGPTRADLVTGPLGKPVLAAWRMAEDLAVIEIARTSGLVLAGGHQNNDPMGATTRGVGELVTKAIECGARRVIVAAGGSATTDGGLDAVEVLEAFRPLDGSRGYAVLVACDVRTTFVNSAATFGPQKGATPEQVTLLGKRLECLADLYQYRYGVDVSQLVGAGAAGGLAGGLAALGATLAPGFDLVAAEVGLERILDGADLVITGEGRLDASSFDGKVVGEVVRMASRFSARVHAIVGDAAPEVRGRIPFTALVDLYGKRRSLSATTTCINDCVTDLLCELSEC